MVRTEKSQEFQLLGDLGKDPKPCFFTGSLLSSAIITLGRHTKPSGSAQGPNWLAVGTYKRLSWKSHVERLPAIRSFLARKLLKGLEDFVTFPQLHWTTWISQGCRFEFFASLCSRVICGRAVLQFCPECDFPTFGKDTFEPGTFPLAVKEICTQFYLKLLSFMKK